MVRRRKLSVTLGYSAIFAASFLYVFASGRFLMEAFPSNSIALGVWALGLPPLILAFYLLFVREERRALRYGITLSNISLSLYGREIPLASIRRAEILSVDSEGCYLGIEFNVFKRGRLRTDIRFLSEKETGNLLELCNKIREVRGWPLQTTILKQCLGDWKRAK